MEFIKGWRLAPRVFAASLSARFVPALVARNMALDPAQRANQLLIDVSHANGGRVPSLSIFRCTSRLPGNAQHQAPP